MNEMKCQFCQKPFGCPINGGPVTFFQCQFCPNDIMYAYSPNLTKYLGFTMCVKRDKGHHYYMRFRNFENPPFSIHIRRWALDHSQKPELNPSPLLTLDYMPPINPSNVEDWLEKLLKIKAFS